MDMIDILGGLLGQKMSRGGKGSDALNDMFKRRSQPTSRQSQPIDIDREAQDLEDLLNVAKDRQGTSTSRQKTPQQKTSQQKTSQKSSKAKGEQALILVKAMINAAKADGQLDQEEQQKILKRLGNPTREQIQFLENEFKTPLDIRGFAMSVPVGMEQQVYMLSLVTIDLDTGAEAKYLMELSEQLRLSPEIREQIHQRVGAPSIY